MHAWSLSRIEAVQSVASLLTRGSHYISITNICILDWRHQLAITG